MLQTGNYPPTHPLVVRLDSMYVENVLLELEHEGTENHKLVEEVRQCVPLTIDHLCPCAIGELKPHVRGRAVRRCLEGVAVMCERHCLNHVSVVTRTWFPPSHGSAGGVALRAWWWVTRCRMYCEAAARHQGRVVFDYVPPHSGHLWNEDARRLAGEVSNVL